MLKAEEVIMEFIESYFAWMTPVVLLHQDELMSITLILVVVLALSAVFESWSIGVLQKAIRVIQVPLMLLGIAVGFALYAAGAANA